MSRALLLAAAIGLQFLLMAQQDPAVTRREEQPTVCQRIEAAFRRPDPQLDRFEVDGRMVAIDELRRRAGDDQLDLEGRHLVILDVLERDLSKRKQLLEDDEFDQRFDELSELYIDSPFTFDVAVTRLRGFPSLTSFKRRQRLVFAFEKGIAPEIDDGSLEAEFERHRDLLSNRKIGVELWFCGANNGKGWDHDGARARAQAILAALLVDEKPAASERDVLVAHGPLTVNQLRMHVRESEFTDLLHDESVTRRLFAAAEGQWIGPMRGTDGYWVARSTKQVEGRQWPPFGEDAKVFARGMLVQRRFGEWADKVLGRTIVRLPVRPR